ncbi:hypothetical protein [Methylobacterium sp. CM6247]
MTLVNEVPQSFRFDTMAVLPKYPVRGLRGLWRAEPDLDSTRRNLGAKFGLPQLAAVSGAPVPSQAGLACKSGSNFLDTGLPEVPTMTVCMVVKSLDTFAANANRPMLYSNNQGDGMSIYVGQAGDSGDGYARLNTNSYGTPPGGSSTPTFTVLTNVPMTAPVFLVTIHTPTQVKLYAPALGLTAAVATRAAGSTRDMAPRNMRIGSSYSVYGGTSNILFVADFNVELTPAEYNLVRATELNWHSEIGSGITF